MKKKKGFTLIELIAVVAITTVLFFAVGSLYVSGSKKSKETKINVDLENNYRITYSKILKECNDLNDGIILNNEVHILDFKLLEDLKEVRCKFAILNKEDDNKYDGTLIVTAIDKEGKKELYIIKSKLYYIPKEGDVIKLPDVVSCEKISSNLKDFTVKALKGGYSFNISFMKDNIERSYEFSLSKKERKIEVEGKNSSEEEGEDSGDKDYGIDDFYKSIGGITLLNGSNINVKGNKLSMKSSSYFLKDSKSTSNESGDYQLKKILRYSKNIYNNKNINDGNINPQGLPLYFNKGNYIIDNNKIFENIKKSKLNVILIDEYGKLIGYKYLESVNKEDIKESIGAFIKVNDEKVILLVNGDIEIKSPLDCSDILIYGSGNITLTNGKKSFENSSLVCGGSINITSPTEISGEYKVDSESKLCINKFLVGGR